MVDTLDCLSSEVLVANYLLRVGSNPTPKANKTLDTRWVLPYYITVTT